MTLSSPFSPSSSSRAAPLGWDGKGWDDGDGDEREILRVEARGGRTLFISHSLAMAPTGARFAGLASLQYRGGARGGNGGNGRKADFLFRPFVVP